LAKKFEASIYNQLVRDAIEDGRHHRHFPDYWADQQLVEVKADSAEEALLNLVDKYPTEKGFVVSTLLEVKFED
jgi:hypothetical protein